MKKSLFLILVFSIIFICSPSLALGSATVEMTVTITSFRVPERAGMVLAPDRPNTEFKSNYSRITISDNIGRIVAKARPLAHWVSWNWTDTIVTGASATLLIPYNESLAPYNIHAEMQVNDAPSNYTVCTANCTPIPPTPNWFYLVNPLEYLAVTTTNVTTCPNSVCIASVNGIGLFQTNIFGYSSDSVPATVICGTITGQSTAKCTGAESGIASYYWRSPSLYTLEL